MKRIVFYIIIFIVIGELMIRFDQSFTLLEDNRIVKISNDIELTPEFKLLNSGNFTKNERDLRIMVIGDSYIHGGGIEFESNFSQQLKRMLQAKELNYDNIWVLDVSKANSNNFDNNQTYFQFVNSFDPNIIILGYNLNDIGGDLDKRKAVVTEIENFEITKTSGHKPKSTIRKIYKVIYGSQFIRFSFKKTHSFIKTFGVILPNSSMDITMKSYYQNRDSWKKSKKLLKEVIDHSNKKNIQLIVYKFPEVNLLEYPQLFAKANKSIKSFFISFPSLIYIDGREVLKGEKSRDYMLSRYDGHPNEKAHKKMADHVYRVINRNYELN